MQDNIPDALIAAFESQYGVHWNHAGMRNERLAMRYGWNAAMEAKPCLHQIQEPASVSNATSQAAPAAVAVPDGWKLVPVDLTPEMKREFMDLLMDGIDIYVNRRDQIEIQTDSPRRIWKAVLALSPAAPKAQADARDALTHAELLEVKRAISDFEDSNETDVPYELLMRAARAGYLECAYFEPLSNSTLDDDIDRAAIATQAELASQDEHERHADWVDDTHASLEARDAKIAAQAAQQGGDEQ